MKKLIASLSILLLSVQLLLGVAVTANGTYGPYKKPQGKTTVTWVFELGGPTFDSASFTVEVNLNTVADPTWVTVDFADLPFTAADSFQFESSAVQVRVVVSSIVTAADLHFLLAPKED